MSKMDFKKDKMEVLEPCPFCGGEAQPRGLDPHFWASCKDCHSETGISNTPQNAITAWNTRTAAQSESGWLENELWRLICQLEKANVKEVRDFIKSDIRRLLNLPPPKKEENENDR